MLKSDSWKTMLAAAICLLLGLFFIATGPVGGDKKADTKVVALSIGVTKPYPRGPEHLAGTGNPRDEFEAARKRGMTADEVRWVVEDFVNFGIDSDQLAAGTGDGYYQLRTKRHQWLLDTLVAGFGLSDEQKQWAAVRLRELAERDYAEFREYLAGMKPIEVEGKMFQVVDGSKVRKLTDASAWMEGDDYLPWNLCELDELQKEIIGFEDQGGQGDVAGGFAFGKKWLYQAPNDPPIAQSGLILPSGKIFPLSDEQVDGIRGANRLTSVRGKHGEIVELGRELTFVGRFGPLRYVKFLSEPQLRTLLLLRPEVAEQLKKELGER